MPRDSVVVKVTIDAAAETVWQLLTVARATWWPEMTFDPRVGSPLVETWIEEDGREASATGVVTRCERPEVLSFRWSEPTWEHPLDVAIRLVETGQSTSVTLAETGFARARTGPSLPDEHEEGWRYHLARLRRASEGGLAVPDASRGP
ncbi:MAG: SRPBCC domain-containing protein [Microbacterium sp.]|uniref:SRPBCC family protein n=1 Tax=Microbacterium sp. TaxID=51671 RepID=UPI0039E2BA10